MLLRIIDRPEQNNENSCVEIVFTSDSEEIVFGAEYFPSHLTENFRKTLAWYFNGYLTELPCAHSREGAETDKDVVTKTLSLGQYMGDAMLGEDHELGKVSHIIGKEGFGQLSVIVESARFEFFEELWEALILPDSPYVLSAVCQGFVRYRNHSGQSIAESYSDDKKELQLSKQAPLTILHLVSRQAVTAGCCFDAQQTLLAFDGAVNYEILPFSDWQTVKKRLQDNDKPVHILQIGRAHV